MIMLKLFQHEKNMAENKYYWLMFLLPVSSITVELCFAYIIRQYEINKSIHLWWMISSISLLFANILVFIIYEYSQKNTKELYELKTIQHQEEQDKKYFEVIEQSNKDMRIFSHDIKNHLTQIRNLDNIDDVQAYIDKLVPNIDKFSNAGISKNKMLDLIISKYATLCESKNIKFDVDVKTANLNYIDDVDLSTLMNNLLDNAVEATEQSKERYIKLNIFSKNNLYDGLIIKNSCDISPINKNNNLETTKSNSKIHGIGISSIKKVIKKYNAVYDWKYDENKKVFETDIAFLKTE
jgi:sensor histidine kinase YesM